MPASPPAELPPPDEAQARAAAALAGLAIAPAHLPGVLLNLGVAARAFAVVAAVPVAPADEIAPAFRP